MAPYRRTQGVEDDISGFKLRVKMSDGSVRTVEVSYNNKKSSLANEDIFGCTRVGDELVVKCFAKPHDDDYLGFFNDNDFGNLVDYSQEWMTVSKDYTRIVKPRKTNDCATSYRCRGY